MAAFHSRRAASRRSRGLRRHLFLQPSGRAATFYERYGALWGALRGKRWLLTPHAVTVPSAAAAANAYELPPYGGGVYAAALAYGPPRGNVTVHLRLPGSPPPSEVAARKRQRM